MLTSNVLLGYELTRGGGQAVQGGLCCPPPRISVRIDNPQILLHHLLQEYLVQRDINSDKGNQTDVGCKHLSLAEIMFTSLTTKCSKIMVQ